MTRVGVASIAQAGLDVEVGLHEVANSASLTLVYFPALVLLAVLGIRFAYYAHRNRAETGMDALAAVWRNLAYIGVLATLYGSLWVVEIVSSIRTPYRSAVMLGMVLGLAFAIRAFHGLGSDGRTAGRTERVTRLAFLGAVFAHLLGVALAASPRSLAALEGLAALAFLAYGATFYHEQTSSARLQGTMVDSLLRHLLPVLTFAGLVSVTALAYGLGLVDPNVVPHIQVVFIIMTASTLMTATIKLRQNLASL